MEKIESEKHYSTDKKLERKKHIYNFKFTRLKKDNNKFFKGSPEKECLSINELVKQSVEKINNLFQQQNLSEIDNKSINHTININNKIKYRENMDFHTINTIEDIKNNQSINKENEINEKIKNEDDLSENLGQNINSGLIVDVSALKRNVKQHSFDFKKLFLSRKGSKNQIDYIQKSNQNEKKYVIQSIESYDTLFNPKSTLDLHKSQNYFSPIKTKKNYLFQSEILRDLSDQKYILEQNNPNIQNRRNKYFSFYRNNNNIKKTNTRNNSRDNKSIKSNNNKLTNSIQRQKSEKYYETNNKRAFSSNNKIIKNDRYNNLRKNTTDNSPKNSTKFNFNNTRIQNINQIKIYASPSSITEKKEQYKSKTQAHLNRVNSSQILNKFYSKEFPLKTKTNDILKLMLFLNEYIINNNLLDDYYIKKNRKILDDYSTFLVNKINLNYPNEKDIICDDFINKTKIIQRSWRKIKVEKYLVKKKFNLENEMKKMVINNYIEKSGFQIKKFLGTFHNLIEQFTLLENKESFNIGENDINKCFFYVKKIINKQLNNFEKNELYKDYINKVIYMN